MTKSKSWIKVHFRFLRPDTADFKLVVLPHQVDWAIAQRIYSVPTFAKGGIMASAEEPKQGVTQGFLERERQKFEDVKGYLDANGEASARTRNFVVTLIVASVLTGVGILNSLQSSWMIERVANWRSSDSPYLVQYIGRSPKLDDYLGQWTAAYAHDLECYQQGQSVATKAKSLKDCPPRPDPNALAGRTAAPNLDSYRQQAKQDYEKAFDLYEKRYDAFWISTTQGLVDNRFFVHVPFFGLNFDVNDLGMLAGVGLASILLLLWFSTETELENLKLSFHETQKLNCFAEFYRLAAMRQVLTIPPLPDREAGRLEVWLPKPIAFLPLAVYLWLFIHDLGTYRVGRQLDTVRLRIFTGSELLFLVAIAALAIQCFRLERKIDSTWASGWCRYIADHFELNGEGKWLKHAWQAARHRQILPAELVDLLPKASSGNYKCEKSNHTHTYESKDGRHHLIVNLQSQSVRYKGPNSLNAATAEPSIPAAAAAACAQYDKQDDGGLTK